MEETLKEIIKKGEKIDTEFKLAKHELPSDLFDTVCSFSNRFGGIIIFGVDDKTRDVVGVNENSIEGMKRNFANLCNNPEKINPTIYLPIEECKINKKTVLYINVPDSVEVYRTAGKIFDRNQDGDYDITNNSYLVTNMYNRKRDIHTEDKIFPYVTLEEDLRTDLIEIARKRAVIKYKEHPWGNMDNFELLKSARLYLKDPIQGIEGFTLGAILLFGTDEIISAAAPNYKTDAIVRKVDVDRYDDRDDVRTNLIESYTRLTDFIGKHTNDPFYLEGMERVSVRDIIARELVSNMLKHRDFGNGRPARIIITKDSLYTENANRPKKYGNINISNYFPYAKNPHIAAVFKDISFADDLGSGVRNLTKYTKIYSKSEPIIKEDEMFSVTIPLLDLDKMAQVKAKMTKISDYDSTMITDYDSTMITDYDKILNFCKTPRNINEIMEFMNLKHKPTFRENYLNPLLKQKKLEMTLPDKPKSKNQKYVTVK
ncbi:MAG: putative DNA binding domain-containing protein [Oscillospiraceae bacterium]|nr:putative DNA binding domain-containing protein [Oscillospiraceae bacterium]